MNASKNATDKRMSPLGQQQIARWLGASLEVSLEQQAAPWEENQEKDLPSYSALHDVLQDWAQITQIILCTSHSRKGNNSIGS